MSYEVQQFRPGSPLVPRDARHASRVVSRHHRDEAVAISAIDGITDVAIAQTDAATIVTGQAMGAVVKVAQAQQQLELITPQASGRLNILADDHAWTMRDIAQDSHRRMRRL